jgi:hypothetical protein
MGIPHESEGKMRQKVWKGGEEFDILNLFFLDSDTAQCTLRPVVQ